MADALLLGTEGITEYVGYLGTAYAVGLGVGISTFVMGYGVWFLLDVFRGGL